MSYVTSIIGGGVRLTSFRVVLAKLTSSWLSSAEPIFSKAGLRNLLETGLGIPWRLLAGNLVRKIFYLINRLERITWRSLDDFHYFRLQFVHPVVRMFPIIEKVRCIQVAEPFV